jgi:predicted transcriptional regulator
MTVKDWPQALHTISEIAEFVRDSEHNIQEFIREDRIGRYFSEGRDV